MDDFALMQKYQLSAKGLQSLFKKLIEVRLLQQTDLDRRNLGFEHTVVLTEDMLSFSAAYAVLGSRRPAAAIEKRPHQPQRSDPIPPTEVKVESASLPDEELYTGPKQAEPDYRSFARPWYDNPSVVIAIMAFFLLVVGGLIFIFLLPNWPFPRFL